jgi:hypothetical protein
VIGVQVDVVEVEGPFINPKIVPERIECRRPKSASTADVDQRSFVDDDRTAAPSVTLSGWTRFCSLCAL